MKRLIIGLFGSGADAADELGTIAGDLGSVGEVAVATDPSEVVGFDAVLVPLIDGKTDVDIASLPIPAIGINIERTKGAEVIFTPDRPFINIVGIRDDAFSGYHFLKRTIQALDEISSKRRLTGLVPDMTTFILVEDDEAIIRSTTRFFRPPGSTNTVHAFRSVASARAGITCSPAVVIIDGNVGGGYEETDALTNDLLALTGSPLAVFRCSGRADLVKAPGHGLLWKPARSGEFQHRIGAVLGWLKKPLS